MRLASALSGFIVAITQTAYRSRSEAIALGAALEKDERRFNIITFNARMEMCRSIYDNHRQKGLESFIGFGTTLYVICSGKRVKPECIEAIARLFINNKQGYSLADFIIL